MQILQPAAVIFKTYSADFDFAVFFLVSFGSSDFALTDFDFAAFFGFSPSSESLGTSPSESSTYGPSVTFALAINASIDLRVFRLFSIVPVPPCFSSEALTSPGVVR